MNMPIRGAGAILVLVLLTFMAFQASASEPCCTVNIQITLEEDVGDVYITGDHPAMGPWNPSLLVMNGSGKERHT